MMTLAFDTSTSYGSVVLFQDQQIIFEKTWLREKSHSEMLPQAIEEAFISTQKKPSQLNEICVAIGPGSFTGIRVAVNIARSFAYSLNCQVKGLDSLDLLARGVSGTSSSQNNMLCMIDAYNNEIFCAQYKKVNLNWKKVAASQSYTLPALDDLLKEPHLCIGEAYNHYEPHLSKKLKSYLIRDPQWIDHPLAQNLCSSSNPSLGQGKPLAWNELQALYIKASAAEEKLKHTL
jgi:tRNA threonylcarbamoyl adenosine modification protein YeaZ